MKYIIALIILFIMLSFLLPIYASAETNNDPEARIRENERLEKELQEKTNQSQNRDYLKSNQKTQRNNLEWEDARRKMLPSASLILSYQSLAPQNKTFQKIVGNPDGLFISLNFSGVVGIGVDLWSKDDLNVSDIKTLDGIAFNATLTYPLVLGNHFLVYAGGGGRFEEITVNERPSSSSSSNSSSDFDAKFGNNAFLLTGGARLRFSGPLGVDFNYSKTYSASYTDYNILRIGLYYDF